MMHPRRLRSTPLCAVLLTVALCSGCAQDRELARSEEGARSEAEADEVAEAVAVPEEAKPVGLVVQMTGLLLLVPTANQGLQVLMPRVADHDALIGFKGPDQGCWRYDTPRGICYVNMDGLSLHPMGVKAGAGAPATSALNLTHGSGKKINIPQAKGRLRSEITLGPGVEREQCSLAQWTFDPVGHDTPPSTVQLINVANWEIDDIGANSIVLTRSRLDGTDTVRIATLLPNKDGRIELLVMHVPRKETNHFFSSTRVQAADTSDAQLQPHGDDDEDEDVVPMVRKHFHAFYNLMGVDPDSTKRPMPTDFKRQKEFCPFTILGLNTAFPRHTASFFGFEALAPKKIDGIRTFSCIMASAEAG